MLKRPKKFGLITFLFLLVSLHSCRFNYSPFVLMVNDKNLNEKNISTILENEMDPTASVKIALIADVHNYYDEFKQQIKKINSSGPYDFVIVNGDLTNLGLWEEYEQVRKMLNELKYPFLVTIGNHDSLSNGRQIFNDLFGETNFHFNFRNTTFIFFNNNNWETPGKIPDRTSIESILRDSNSMFKILVAHIPFNDKDRFTSQEINSWEELLHENKINYFINGHNHKSEEMKWDDFYQLTIGSPNQGGLMELIIDEKNISHRKLNY